MTAQPINMRLTVVGVFAFLFIVALFVRPGGAAEQATDQLATVAEKTVGKQSAPVRAAPVQRASPAWFAPDGEQDAMDAAPNGAAEDTELAPVPGDLPLVDPDPPPQGPDFPEND